MRLFAAVLLVALAVCHTPVWAQKYVECGSQPVVQNGRVIGESPTLCRVPYEATVTAVGYLAMDEAQTMYAFDVGVAGWAFGNGTIKRRAIEKCETSGRSCTVVIRYMPSLFSRAKLCVGIASDERKYLWSYGSTADEAIANALKACKVEGRICSSDTVASCAVGATMIKY